MDCTLSTSGTTVTLIKPFNTNTYKIWFQDRSDSTAGINLFGASYKNQTKNSFVGYSNAASSGGFMVACGY